MIRSRVLWWQDFARSLYIYQNVIAQYLHLSKTGNRTQVVNIAGLQLFRSYILISTTTTTTIVMMPTPLLGISKNIFKSLVIVIFLSRQVMYFGLTFNYPQIASNSQL